jgi:hypothetical protein
MDPHDSKTSSPKKKLSRVIIDGEEYQIAQQTLELVEQIDASRASASKEPSSSENPASGPSSAAPVHPEDVPLIDFHTEPEPQPKRKTEDEIPDNPETNKAATIIEANVRGFLLRKSLKKSSDGGSLLKAQEQHGSPNAAIGRTESEPQSDILPEESKGLSDESESKGLSDKSASSSKPQPTRKTEDEIPDNPKTNKAATIIEANVRGFLLRKSLKKSSDGGSLLKAQEQHDSPNAAIGRTESEPQSDILPEESKGLSDKSASSSKPQPARKTEEEIPDTPETNKAATVIQANVRGFLLRKSLKKSSDEGNAGKTQQQQESPSEIGTGPTESVPQQDIQTEIKGLSDESEPKQPAQKTEEEIPDTPETNKAATVIQANVRGFLLRKSLKKSSDEGNAGKTQQQQESHEVQPQPDILAELKGLSDESEFKRLSDESESKRLYDKSVLSNGSSSKPQPPIKTDEEMAEDPASNHAATVIQANVRGFLLRKSLRKSSDGGNPSSTAQQQAESHEEPKLDNLAEANRLSAPSEENRLSDISDSLLLSVESGPRRSTAKSHSLKSASSKSQLPRKTEGEFTDDFETNKAATRIQANFRGFLVRKNLRKSSDEGNVEKAQEKHESSDAGPGLTEGEPQSDIRIESEKRLSDETESNKRLSEKSVSSNPQDKIPDDPETNKAATIIQANIRGFLVRKNLRKSSDEGRSVEKAQEKHEESSDAGPGLTEEQEIRQSNASSVGGNPEISFRLPSDDASPLQQDLSKIPSEVMDIVVEVARSHSVLKLNSSASNSTLNGTVSGHLFVSDSKKSFILEEQPKPEEVQKKHKKNNKNKNKKAPKPKLTSEGNLIGDKEGGWILGESETQLNKKLGGGLRTSDKKRRVGKKCQGGNWVLDKMFRKPCPGEGGIILSSTSAFGMKDKEQLLGKKNNKKDPADEGNGLYEKEGGWVLDRMYRTPGKSAMEITPTLYTTSVSSVGGDDVRPTKSECVSNKKVCSWARTILVAFDSVTACDMIGRLPTDKSEEELQEDYCSDGGYLDLAWDFCFGWAFDGTGGNKAPNECKIKQQQPSTSTTLKETKSLC